jgi:hypothetical protein
MLSFRTTCDKRRTYDAALKTFLALELHTSEQSLEVLAPLEIRKQISYYSFLVANHPLNCSICQADIADFSLVQRRRAA